MGIMLTYKNEWIEIMQVNELSEHVETSISIIIPARNEVKNIIHLLSDILKQDYPKELFDPFNGLKYDYYLDTINSKQIRNIKLV